MLAQESHFQSTETSLKTRSDLIELRIRRKTYEKLRNVLVFIKNGKKRKRPLRSKAQTAIVARERRKDGGRDRRRYHPPINMCSKLVIYNLL